MVASIFSNNWVFIRKFVSVHVLIATLTYLCHHQSFSEPVKQKSKFFACVLIRTNHRCKPENVPWIVQESQPVKGLG